jgi:hypothetical protein
MQGTALFRALNNHLPTGRENKSVSQKEFTGNTQETNILRIGTGAQLINEAPQNIRLLYTRAIQHHWSDYYQDGTARRVASGS